MIDWDELFENLDVNDFEVDSNISETREDKIKRILENIGNRYYTDDLHEASEERSQFMEDVLMGLTEICKIDNGEYYG